MGKRKYVRIKEMEACIISMREAGLTRQEIADELGLGKAQIKNWAAWYNRGVFSLNGIRHGSAARRLILILTKRLKTVLLGRDTSGQRHCR